MADCEAALEGAHMLAATLEPTRPSGATILRNAANETELASKESA